MVEQAANEAPVKPPFRPGRDAAGAASPQTLGESKGSRRSDATRFRCERRSADWGLRMLSAHIPRVQLKAAARAVGEVMF